MQVAISQIFPRFDQNDAYFFFLFHKTFIMYVLIKILLLVRRKFS